jgi:hypothetical protein
MLQGRAPLRQPIFFGFPRVKLLAGPHWQLYNARQEKIQ